MHVASPAVTEDLGLTASAHGLVGSVDVGCELDQIRSARRKLALERMRNIFDTKREVLVAQAIDVEAPIPVTLGKGRRNTSLVAPKKRRGAQGALPSLSSARSLSRACATKPLASSAVMR